MLKLKYHKICIKPPNLEILTELIYFVLYTLLHERENIF